ncbi:chromophore lyase CpcT/CpeT [Cylindrospermum stagnale]|nr:chromophore lyase CpcT/CpeT [Cylindrospermum stagnale]
MNNLRISILTIILSTLTLAQGGRTLAVAPSLETQVQDLAQWFTGYFDNEQQVASNSSVPLITMSNCNVQLDNTNFAVDTQNVYLEQKSTAFERLRLYSFSKGDSVVKLSIYNFLNADVFRGTCNHPESARIISQNNLAVTSCNLELIWQPTAYIGNNAPNGCLTSTGGKVVSQVTISKGKIDSLDQIFSAQGRLLVSTPIQFRQVDEPSLALGLLAVGIWSLAKQSPKNSPRKNHKLRIGSKRMSENFLVMYQAAVDPPKSP